MNMNVNSGTCGNGEDEDEDDEGEAADMEGTDYLFTPEGMFNLHN